MFHSLYRRIWRWHFWVGLLACPVLLVLSITGALYTFREEIENWQRSDLTFVESGSLALPASTQLAAAQLAYPDWKPTRITLSPDSQKATVILVDRPDKSAGTNWAVFVNPATAAIVGDSDARSPFFTTVLKIHRTLFAGTFGRIVVESTTSWTFVLLVSGVCLWWPRNWRHVSGVWLPRLRAKPYTVLRDLHSIAGILFAPVLGLIAFTGLFFTIVWLWSFNAVTDNAGNFPRPLLAALPSAVAGFGIQSNALDRAATEASERYPHDTLTIQLPKKAEDSFQITARHGSGPSVSGRLSVDRSSGTVLGEQRAENLSLPEQARLYVLPIHMGTIGGSGTKVLAFLACLVLAGLGISGVWMWLRRRPMGATGFPRSSDSPVPKAAVITIVWLAVVFPTVGLSLIAVLVGEWVFHRFTRRVSPNESAVDTANSPYSPQLRGPS